MPLWGTKSWEFVSALIAIGLCGLGIWYMILGITSGTPVWWYNSSIVFFGVALIGLVLLVREGKAAFNNIMKYGRNPNTKEETPEEEETPLSTMADEY
jgi:hypothetical protein